MLQCAPRVVEAEEQRANRLPFGLVPAEAGYDTFGRTRMLHLDHRALARLVEGILRLRDHAVQAGALKLIQPLNCEVPIPCHGRKVHRRADVGEQLIQQAAPLALRSVHPARAGGR